MVLKGENVMTNEEEIKHITTWLYAAPDLPPMQVVQALELAVAALRAGGTDTNVPTMPAGQPLTLEQLRGMDGKPVWITDLLACAETSEERCKELEGRCKRLDEARERANEAAAKWESMYIGKKGEAEMLQDEVFRMQDAGMKMLNAFSEYVRNGSKNPAAYCYYGAAGCGGDGDGCKGVAHCNFLPKSGMKGG